MRSIRALRILTSRLTVDSQRTHLNSPFLQRFYSAETQPDPLPTSSTEEEDDSTSSSSSVFDSSEYSMGFNLNNDLEAGKIKNPTWNEKYRDKVTSKIFGEEVKSSRILKKSEEKKKNAAVLAMSLLDAAVQRQDKEEEEEEESKVVKEEDQRSLTVGIIGAPNAGKSALTNFMVCCYFFFFTFFSCMLFIIRLKVELSGSCVIVIPFYWGGCGCTYNEKMHYAIAY